MNIPLPFSRLFICESVYEKPSIKVLPEEVKLVWV